MAYKFGVLVFPAGEINAVEIHDALSACVNIRLYGASSVDRHGKFVFEHYISNVPKITEPDFIPVLNQIIARNQIDVVIPTHDDVALFFAENRKDIHATALTSDLRTALICRDKKKTYELFAEQPFCPRMSGRWEGFPLFLKPRRGQGGVGAKRIRGVADIPANIDMGEFVLCEYLPGEELTVDCFTDKDGMLRAVLPRSRQRIFGGVSVRAQRKELTPEILNIASAINEELNFLGLWYFQIKQDRKGKFKLLEISTRCAGTMCLSRATGINLPLLSVYTAMGLETEVVENDYQITVDRTLISRYQTDLDYQCVYIDLDDTIIVHGKICLPVLRFLYQCVNQQKKIILLTRHRETHTDDALNTLRQYRIAPELFDEIIEIPSDIKKHSMICPEKAIFIDNSFAERKSVRKNLGIPVFDVSEIEVLLDWRT